MTIDQTYNVITSAEAGEVVWDMFMRRNARILRVSFERIRQRGLLAGVRRGGNETNRRRALPVGDQPVARGRRWRNRRAIGNGVRRGGSGSFEIVPVIPGPPGSSNRNVAIEQRIPGLIPPSGGLCGGAYAISLEILHRETYDHCSRVSLLERRQ